MDTERFRDLYATVDTLRAELSLGVADATPELGDKVMVQLDLQAAMSHVVQGLLQATDCIRELQQQVNDR